MIEVSNYECTECKKSKLHVQIVYGAIKLHCPECKVIFVLTGRDLKNCSFLKLDELWTEPKKTEVLQFPKKEEKTEQQGMKMKTDVKDEFKGDIIPES